MALVEPLLVRRALLGTEAVDVLLLDGRVAAVGGRLPDTAARTLDARGAVMLPGLHDHHLHLLATAAAHASVQCGPPHVCDREQLGQALANREGFVRGVGFHESAVGLLDRTALDALVDDRPVRIQHRSGALWVLNSTALEILGLAETHTDGRLWRQDHVLRERIATVFGSPQPPDLADLGRRLASYGITGVTDATPGDASALAAAARRLPQHLLTLGDDPTGTLDHGPRKIIVDDQCLPDLDELTRQVEAAHDQGRGIAAHAVTREALLLTITALTAVGPHPADRIEHAAVAPPEAITALAQLGVTVVTQPSLIAGRGDTYLDSVDEDDVAFLWPFASLRAAGVRVGCGSDAPYGDVDPWQTITAAVTRRAPDGRVVGPNERVDTWTALEAFLTSPDDPGGRPRVVAPGQPADLVLVTPGSNGLTDARVQLTVIGGHISHLDTDAVRSDEVNSTRRTN